MKTTASIEFCIGVDVAANVMPGSPATRLEPPDPITVEDVEVVFDSFTAEKAKGLGVTPEMVDKVLQLYVGEAWGENDEVERRLISAAKENTPTTEDIDDERYHAKKEQR